MSWGIVILVQKRSLTDIVQPALVHYNHCMSPSVRNSIRSYQSYIVGWFVQNMVHFEVILHCGVHT